MVESRKIKSCHRCTFTRFSVKFGDFIVNYEIKYIKNPVKTK